MWLLMLYCTSMFYYLLLKLNFLAICIKELYEHDVDFSHIYHTCSHTTSEVYFKHDGYLIKDKRLCIPKGSIRRIFVKEAHDGELMDFFGVPKT